jgi:phosphatidylserine/phosphatidylglycerophosphate/cardiolipin synthase-like enzyme
MKSLTIAAALHAGVMMLGAAIAAPTASAATGIEVGFSPGGSAEALVLRTIASSRHSIRLAAYSFTAAPVVQALIQAKKRGIDVAVVVDHRHNLVEDRTGKPRAALNALANAGVLVHTVSAYPMQHSKYVVIDGSHVQTGSYNYSVAAARFNAENVLVISSRPDVAVRYLANWTRLYEAGLSYSPAY